jgi:hypothetical protein
MNVSDPEEEEENGGIGSPFRSWHFSIHSWYNAHYGDVDEVAIASNPSTGSLEF